MVAYISKLLGSGEVEGYYSDSAVLCDIRMFFFKERLGCTVK